MKKKLFGTFVLISLLTVIAAVCLSAPSEGVSFAQESVTYITSPQQLQTLSKKLFSASDVYRLECDVDYDYFPFKFDTIKGVFDGNGHTVYNATDSFASAVDVGGTVKNLNFYNLHVENNASGGYFRGAVAMENYGSVLDVTVTGSATAVSGCGVSAMNYGTISGCSVYLDFTAVKKSGDAMFGGIAVTNDGVISDCFYFGDLTVNDVTLCGGIAARNGGTISSCGVSAEVVIDDFSVGDNPSAYGSRFGGIVGECGIYAEREGALQVALGEVADCFFRGGFSVVSTEKTGLTGGGIVGLSVKSMVSGCYTAVTVSPAASTFDGLRGKQGSAVAFEEETISNNLSTVAFGELGESNALVSVQALKESGCTLLGVPWTGTGRYPTQSTLLASDGEFLVGNRSELLRLNFFADEAISVRQTADITFGGYFPQINGFCGDYDGKGFAFLHLIASPFANASGHFENVGFIECSVTDASDGESYTATNCYVGYTDLSVEGKTILVLSEEEPQGSGTSSDPYVITTKEQLAYLDNSSGFFELGCDVNVNDTFDQYRYKLNLSGFSGTLDGKGHSVVGLLGESLFGDAVFSGTVKNLTVRGYNPLGALLASSTNNFGSAVSVTTYGKAATGIVTVLAGSLTSCANYAEATYGIISSSENGVITSCVNYGAVTCAIGGLSGTARVKNCINRYAGATLYSGSDACVATSVNAGSSVSLYDGGLLYEAVTVPSSVFSQYPAFDSVSVWGYPVGRDDYPVLRESGVSYKNEGKAFFNASVISKSVTYTGASLSSLSELQQGVLKDKTKYDFVSFDWYYAAEGEPTERLPLTELFVVGEGESATYYIKNAGTYRLCAVYPGTDTVTGYTMLYDYKVSKGTLPSPNMYGTSGIVGVTGAPYVYNGENYDVKNVAASNYAAYGITEDDYSYVIMSGGEVISDTDDEDCYVGGAFVSGILHGGKYSVTFTVANRNYKTVIGSVNVTVTPRNLHITVDDKSTEYLSAPSGYTFGIDVDTAGLDDTEADRQHLIAQQAVNAAGVAARTAYVIGNDAGNYDITAEFVSTDYAVTVTKGSLTVSPRTLTFSYLSELGVTFADKTVRYNGEIQKLTAATAEGVGVVYENNDNVAKGSYSVTAVFSMDNYTDCREVRTLEIEACPITLAPNAASIYYNEHPTYSLADVALKGGDVFSAQFSGEAVFSDNYDVGDDCGEYLVSLSGITSSNYAVSFGTAILTVSPVSMKTLFEYPDKSVPYTGSQVSYPLYTGDITVSVTYKYYFGGVELTQKPVTVGSYRVEATATKINGNYLDTLFVATLTVSKKEVSGITLPSSHTLTYTGKALIINYVGTLPGGEAAWTIEKQILLSGESVTQIFGVGSYQYAVSFKNNANYADFSLSSTVNVTKKELTLRALPHVTYSGKPYNTELNPLPAAVADESVPDVLTYTYLLSRAGSSAKVSTVTNAGTYNCYATCTNDNYSVKNVLTLVVDALPVAYTPRYISYTYGEYRDDYYFDYVKYTISDLTITEHNYFIAATNETVDVQYTYGSGGVGVVNALTIYPISNYAFTFALGSNMNVVNVSKRPITVAWDKTEKTVSYNGLFQNPFSMNLSNIVGGDTVTYRFASNGDMKNVGIHEIWVEFNDSGESDNEKYTIPSDKVKMTISKATLTVKANDISIQKGHTPTYGYTLTGLQGNDTLAKLGVTVKLNCAYVEGVSVGATMPITVTPFGLANYDVVCENGLLTVVQSPYTTLTMSNKTFTYDGKIKSVAPNESLPAGARIDYGSTNYRSSAGEYTVVATITYADGTSQILRAILTILKAAAEVTVEPLVLPFSVLAKLENNDIIGSGSLKGRDIPGQFRWLGNTELKKGTNTYTVRFTPNDADNFVPTDKDVTVEGREVTVAAFSFSDESTVTANTVLHVKKGTVMSLNDTYDGLVMLVDGKETSEYTVPLGGAFFVELLYKGNRVFSANYKVEEIPEEVEPEPEPEIVWDENVFSIEYGYFSGDTIFTTDQCRLKLLDRYTDATFFVNGRVATTTMLFGTEEQVKLQIKYKGELVYSKTFKVMEEPEPTEEKPERQTDPLLWAKVLGGVGGGALLIVALFFIIKKAAGRGGREFNPYDKIK